jgi:hypothetical protein
VARSPHVHRCKRRKERASDRCCTRLDQKVRGQVSVLRTHRPQTLHHRRRGETYPTQANRRNVVSLLVSRDGYRQRKPP